MAVFVIADLHLSNSTPDLLEGFTGFINKLKDGDELYIIGDLFNFFVGLDQSNQAQKLVAKVLSQAKERGISSYFIKGNRDFLMTEAEAKSLGLTLCDDICLIEKSGKPIILSHGDLFCTNDLAYQKYYRLVNNKFLQLLFRMLPLFVRRKIASRIREQSKDAHYHRRDPLIYGVVPKSIDNIAKDLCDKNNCSNSLVVVHGHIHEFSFFSHEGDFVNSRYVLGAWGNQFSYWAITDDGHIVFKELALSKLKQQDLSFLS